MVSAFSLAVLEVMEPDRKARSDLVRVPGVVQACSCCPVGDRHE